MSTTEGSGRGPGGWAAKGPGSSGESVGRLPSAGRPACQFKYAAPVGRAVRMKVGILGSGDVAKALAHGFLSTGNEVRLGTRDPKGSKLTEWTRSAGSAASVGSFAEAARFGELVVVATRGTETVGILKAVGADPFHGKVVIDVTNPLVFAPNAPPTLSVGFSDSLGEQVQRALPGAHVVKAFNTVGNSNFYQPKFGAGAPDMFIGGNDAAAKARVREVLRSFGWTGVVDLGGIDAARLLEAMCLVWVRSAMGLNDYEIAFKLLRK